jgi:hypothetical protein
MNTNVKSICEIIDEVKEKLTDYQYKTIMDNLMALNNKKEEEELEENSRQISILNLYVETINDIELKNVFIRRLDMLRCLFSERS